MQADERQLDRVFFALSDATRRAIVARLAAGSTSIGELARPFEISAPAITKHLKVLERAGLIERRVNGRVHNCSLSPDALRTAEDWLGFLREFRESRLDALEELLDQDNSKVNNS